MERKLKLWNLNQLKKNIPHLNYNDARFPILGAAVQRRAGNARHDSVAWGYARAADQLGVDILQNCEVTGVKRNKGRIEQFRNFPRFNQSKKNWFCRGRKHFATLGNG